MPDALDGMPVFVAVAETRSFRAAGERLGVSSSAVSQALRKLEERLGVALARRPKPKHPRDLARHECLNWHPAADAPPYRWEFTENGKDFSVAVPARVLSTDPALLIRLTRAGVGLGIVYEGHV